MIVSQPRTLVLILSSLACSSSAWAQPLLGSANSATADPPVARPATQPCTVTLFSDVAFADYSPKSFSYAPPAACRGPWAKVVLSADFAVSAGRQYDRTANIWIGGANVYFGTTAEPSATVARSWHVERDLTDYAALFGAAQAGEVDLGNTVNATYTGVLTGSAVVQLYPLARGQRPPVVADAVLPLSAGPTGGTVALATTASTLARSFTLPTNVERAYLDVIAQSQSGDEFWYTCVPDDVAGALQSCGGSGFRETEVSVDGQPAGVAPVYPWIYTGGIDPYLWEPIPGVQTFDFAPYRVDLTPFAGLLSDGQPHTVALSVFNADNYFSTTASLLIYRDPGARRVRGAVTQNTLAAAPVPTVTEQLTTAADGSISGSVTVASTRDFRIAGYVDTSHGRVRTAIEQHIAFHNRQQLAVSAASYVQDLAQRTDIVAVTRSNERVSRVERAWPLTLRYAYSGNADGSATQTTTVEQQEQAQRLDQLGPLPLDFAIRSNVVSSSDTMAFDGAGALTGLSGRNASQRYFSADSDGRCYSRTLTAAAGKLTAIDDGQDCR